MGKHRRPLRTGWDSRKRQEIKARKATNRQLSYLERPGDPRRVGGEYYDGHWKAKYVVLAIERPRYTIRWETGEVADHMGGWDHLLDKVIRQPGERK